MYGYDKKEYGKQHYQDNKEHYKQYYEEHKEKISEQKKQKYHSNKEKISEQRKQNMVCECGEIITKINIPRHTRSFKHMNPFCDYPKTNIFT